MTLSHDIGQKPLTFAPQSAPIVPSLGNLANISSASPIIEATNAKKYTRSASQRKKERRFLLQDFARRFLRNHNTMNSRGTNPHRTRTCMTVRFDKTEDIGITLNANESQSAAGLSNLVTCGSICSCAVCAHRIMLEYAQDIKKALKWAQEQKLVPIMVTLTAQHHKTAKLEEFIKQFKSAWRYFSSGRQWRKFKQKYKIAHHITAREITRGRKTDNGWHYHMHVLLFLDAGAMLDEEEMSDITREFQNRWIAALHRENLNGIPEIACDVRAGEHVGEQYLTKLGLTQDAKGKLEYELTGNENKGASIWDILYDAAMGDVEAEYLYLEYVEVMTGENWITFSHGLRDLIADIELETEVEAEQDKLVLWYWITQENWNVIVRNGAIGKVLLLAAKYRCRDTINEYIRMLRDD